MSQMKIEDLPRDLVEIKFDNVSNLDQKAILGGNCSYGGHSYSPGSVINMPGGPRECKDGWFSDYWEPVNVSVHSGGFTGEAEAYGSNTFE